WLLSSWAASHSLAMTWLSGTSVGLPMPRSMTSMPARRLAYFRALILPNRYGGRRLTRSATSTRKGCCGTLGSLCMTSSRVEEEERTTESQRTQRRQKQKTEKEEQTS